MNVLLTAFKVPNTVRILLRPQKQRKKNQELFRAWHLSMLYTSRIEVSTNPLRKKKRKEKMNHTKIKNEPISDTKHKN